MAELQHISADHFGAVPGTVLWGQAADVARWNEKLREITDAHFHRGEFAARRAAQPRPRPAPR